MNAFASVGRRTLGFAIGALALVGAIAPAAAQFVRQLTDVKTGATTVAAMDDNGTEVFVSSSTNQLGLNPSHAFQLVRFTATTGAGAQLTSATDGISDQRFVVSVSDDDQWVAFVSRENTTGQNSDRSGEVFVVQRDGTSLQQLTNHPGAATGEPSIAMIAGGGAKVAFVSTGNLTGGNAAHHPQIFLVNRDGTGLTQVTSLAGADIDFLSISDDATKIAFGSEANPFGTNADGNVEIFAINADGTGLKQLTSTTNPGNGPAVMWMSFAGGGSKIAFSGYADPLGTNSDHGSEVFVVDFAGTNLKQLTNSTGPFGNTARDSEYPAITDDGINVYFTSNQFTLTQNSDGSFELWKIKTDGTGKTLLTNNGIHYAELVVSGSGNRVAFRDIDGDGETKVIDATGASLRSLTSTTRYSAQYATIDSAATIVQFSSTADMVPPGNSGHTAEIFTMRPDGSGLAQLTSGLDVLWPSVSRDALSIVFASKANPTGQNPSASHQVFRINTDGSGLTQVTRLTNGSLVYTPAASRDGSVIVFTSNSNDTGQNAGRGYQEFRINSDGTGFVQLTQVGANQLAVENRIDAAGVWFTFESNANLDGAHPYGTNDLYRMHTDGTGLQSITNGGATGSADYPDISADGATICFNSSFDLTGGNSDHNDEVFVWQAGTIRQLTSSVEGFSIFCRISDDGAWMYFESSAPLLEANPLYFLSLYRANVSTGVVERVEGLGFGTAYYDGVATDFGNAVIPSVDGNGTHVAWAQSTNGTRANPDFFKEVVMYDYSTPPALSISSGPAPTHVSWDVNAGPVRYDVVRGDVASLRINGSSVDLGTVACVKNDSPVNSTEGSDDGLTPAPGHAFFYVYRGSQGLGAGPGSYGTGSSGKERVASSGDCSP